MEVKSPSEVVNNKIKDDAAIKNEQEVIMKFYNDGEKIEEKEMNKVFQCFSKGKNGNFGLGLAIVKQIVDLNNGEVWCKNEDEGVAFYIKSLSSVLH